LLAQHGWPAKRVEQAAVNMTRLTFGVEQRGVFVNTLHATEAAAAIVRLFDPFTLDLPPVVEADWVG
jgi:hypothetical protein